MSYSLLEHLAGRAQRQWLRSLLGLGILFALCAALACRGDNATDNAGDGPPLMFGLMMHIEPQISGPCTRDCDDCGKSQFELHARAMDRIASVYEKHGAVISMQVGLGYAESSKLWPDTPGSVQDLERRGHEISVHIHYPVGGPGGFRAISCLNPTAEDYMCGPDSPPQDASCTRPSMTNDQYCDAITARVDAVNDVASSKVTGLCAATGGTELNLFDCLKRQGISYVSGLVTHSPLVFKQNASCPKAAVGHSSLTMLNSHRPPMASYADDLYAEGMLDED
jgi:hypothetical protein